MAGIVVARTLLALALAGGPLVTERKRPVMVAGGTNDVSIRRQPVLSVKAKPAPTPQVITRQMRRKAERDARKK
jgi:hypothetical protein